VAGEDEGELLSVGRAMPTVRVFTVLVLLGGLAEAGVAVREAELARAALDLSGRVRRAFYAVLAGQRRRAETEGQLRLAERTRDVARARFESGDVPRLDVVQDAYRSGQTGLPALLQAQQATREIPLSALQAGADYQAALADLEGATGAPLP